MEYLQSKHIAQRNSTSEQEDKEDAMKPLSCQDTVEAMEDDCGDNQKALLDYSKLDTAESQLHWDPALSGPQETVGHDQHFNMCQQKGRNLLLLHAVLVVCLTYQASLTRPTDLWEEKKAYHRRNRKLFARGIPLLSGACVILDLVGLTGAFGAVSSRKVSTSVYVFILVCITLQVLVRVGSGPLAKSSFLGHKFARSKCPLMILRILDHLGNATRRSSESAEAAADEATWLVDSGASHHVTGNRSLLLNGGYLPVHGEVVVVYPTNGGEVPLRVRGIGSVRTGSIVLDDVWYVPGLDLNLVSTGQLVRQGCAVTLGPGGCRITRAGALVGSARFTEACHFQLDFLKLADP